MSCSVVQLTAWNTDSDDDDYRPMSKQQKTTPDSDDDKSLNKQPSLNEDDILRDKKRRKRQRVNTDSDDDDYRPMSKQQNTTPDSDDDKSLNKQPSLSEDDILRDKKRNGIYVKKYKFKKSGKRCYDNTHACVYCGKIVLHINLHLKTHRNKEEVKEILRSEKQDFTELRKKGDDRHNREVLELGEGEIILARRSRDLKFDVRQYGPCPACREWVALKGLKYHYKSCSTTQSINHVMKPKKKDLVVQSQVLAGHIDCTSKLLQKEVIPIMTQDDVSSTAQEDPLIRALGESWIKRNVGNKEKRPYYASARMRLAARLLLQLKASLQQKDADKELHLWDFLRPKYFDEVVLAALKCSFPIADDVEDLGAPSNAIKLNYDIIRIINCKWGMIVKETGPEDSEAKECEAFLRLMDKEWKEKVTTTARAVLSRRKFEEKKDLPSPEDIEKITRYLVEKLQKMPLDSEHFSQITVAAQTRLLMYNKRRTGELEVIRYALLQLLYRIHVLFLKTFLLPEASMFCTKFCKQ